MVDLTINRVRQLMGRPANIRNMSVVGHIGHGKSTLIDSLAQKFGVDTVLEEGNDHFIGNSHTEHNYGTTIRLRPTPLYAKLATEQETTLEEADSDEYLINLIDSPGHVDFSDEAAAALRLTDGALVAVDCIEGVTVLTETLLQQVLRERVKPAIVITKIDRVLFQPQRVEKEDIYQSFLRIITGANLVLSTHAEKAMDDALISPDSGTVAFSSSKFGWAFTIQQFAVKYARRFGVDKQKMQRRLWGDWFFSSTTKKWTKISDGTERSFNMFILDPIFKIHDASTKSTTEQLVAIAAKLEVDLTEEEIDLPSADLLKIVLQKFLPITDALVQMMVLHLPSPIAAQKYRAETLYQGPSDDAACIGIRQCDRQADLMLAVSNIVHIPNSTTGQFYSVGRVFSGKVKPGMKTRVQDHGYMPGRKESLYIKKIESVLFLGQTIDEIEDVPAGNIVGITGVDQYLLKCGTLTTMESAYNFRPMRQLTLPLVQHVVDVEEPTDLPKLVEGLKHLAKSDLCVRVGLDGAGGHTIAGAGEFHLEVCLQKLKHYTGISLKISDPTVSHRETVGGPSSMIALSKSPNKHNRLWVAASPLGEELTNAIDQGVINPRDDFKARARLLADGYGWDENQGRKIWAFGPETSGPNVVVDTTSRVQYLHEIKDSFMSGFEWATGAGPIAEEPMRSIRFDIKDVGTLSDAIHRGGGQIIPTARRVLYAASLLASPQLLEPVYRVEMHVPSPVVNSVRSIVTKRRGRVFAEDLSLRPGISNNPSICKLRAYLPVKESFGFHKAIRKAIVPDAIGHESTNLHHSEDQTPTTMIFDHWQPLPGSPLDPNTVAGKTAIEIRKAKGLEEMAPSYEKYHDKL